MKTVTVIIIALALLFVGIPVFACGSGHHYGWSNGQGNPHNPGAPVPGKGFHKGWNKGNGNPPAPPAPPTGGGDKGDGKGGTK